ncbi:hypothetical protein SASPL_101586 [Salvia splendens]|uniref:Bet v I/Major latex protein domain-containing protein n=1 Tax=Salvia splendens TaxID=180675 RepID=A0A8X8YR43_SALSN|nr:hypothetical protein SASPL_101586 [Salvia splendens]
MVAITYDIEVTSSLPAAKMFKAMVLDAGTLIPKIMPQAIKNVEIVEGDGGVGTVKIIHFGEGSQYKIAKHRLEAIDKENLTHTYSIIEGDALAAGVHLPSTEAVDRINCSARRNSLVLKDEERKLSADVRLVHPSCLVIPQADPTNEDLVDGIVISALSPACQHFFRKEEWRGINQAIG